MYYLQDTGIQVHYNWQVANWRQASKLSSFLKHNTLFDVSVEYLIEHRYALCFIVYARLYLHRISAHLQPLSPLRTPPLLLLLLVSFPTRQPCARHPLGRIIRRALATMHVRLHNGERHYTSAANGDVFYRDRAYVRGFIREIFVGGMFGHER